MRYEDRIYGTADIHEPVLIALLQSAAMLRLRGVLQHGISGLIGLTAPVSRFEHSVGVMLLVRRMGAPLQEQIAALLHDVSHTAFSHVIDYVFDGHDDQSYHERAKEQFVAASDLPEVLAEYGYDWRDFLHEDTYPLLEQPAPALCADRLDYFLRDSLDLKLGTFPQMRRALDHLVLHAGRIMVDDLDAARWFAYTYIAADELSWANFREVGLYEVTARAIRLGLDRGVLSEADLWGVDQSMWDKLRVCDDPVVQAQLALVSLDTRFVWDDVAPDFWVSTKLRTIDPDVIVNGNTNPLSALDPDFARHRESYLRRKTGKWPIRVIPSYHISVG